MAATLLPELLLALVGAPGDAFVVRGASIVLAEEIDWVTPPERCALLELLSCGGPTDQLLGFELRLLPVDPPCAHCSTPRQCCDRGFCSRQPLVCAAAQGRHPPPGSRLFSP